jgi:hypothetical protein
MGNEAARPGDAGGRRPGLTRRQALVGAGGAVGGLAALGAVPAAAAHEEGTSLGGVITRIDGPRRLEIEPADPKARGRVAVELSRNAELYRDQPATLSDFAVGDEVAVGGTSSADGTFAATRLESIYRLVETKVERRDGDRLDTADGTLELHGSSRAEGGHAAGHHLEAKPLGELRAGDRVVATGRRHATRPVLLVSEIGVVSG